MRKRDFVVGLILGISILFGCEIDPCADGNCDEVHALKNPHHQCAPGFEGKSCNIRSIDKFIGVYTMGKGGSNACIKVDSPLEITEKRTDYQSVVFKDGILDHPFEGKVEGWQVVIPPQENVFTEKSTGKRFDVTVSGKAWIDLSKNTLTYKFDAHGCEYSFPLPEIKARK